MGLFEPLAVNLPALIAVTVFYVLFGYKLQDRWFDFDEQPLPGTGEHELPGESTHLTWKAWLTLGVTAAVVMLLVCGADTGFAALLGAAVLILTGCESESEAFSSVCWPVVIIAAGAIGFFKGAGLIRSR